MRLTLRTLLAYLDDILDPADKEQLAKKIETSEFAEDLVHRTRDTVRRLRLSAPQVIGSGMGLDPNTVAEYLDNVLPPESVGDFERICLESDMHLAEAAACHHILTMVLGEPADVDPLARQRMYTIPTGDDLRKRHRVEAAHVAVAAEPLAQPSVEVITSPGGVVAEVVTEQSGVTEIPDYLRTSRWSGYRGPVLGVAVVLLAGATIFLSTGMRGWFGGTAQVAPLADSTNGGMATADASAPAEEVATPADLDEATRVLTEGAPPPAIDGPTGDEQVAASDVAPPMSASPEAVTPGVAPPVTLTEPDDRYPLPQQAAATGDQASGDQQTAAVASESATGEPALPIGDELPATEPMIGDPAAENVRADGDPPSIAALPTEPEIGLPTESVEAGTGSEDFAATAGAVSGDVAMTGLDSGAELAPTEEVPAGPAELGTYLGGKTVLLRYDDEAGAWFRVEPRNAVVAGNRLLALPEFRPKITLTSGVHVDVSGGTQLVLRTAEDVPSDQLPAAGPDVPAVEVVYGRVILINTSNAKNQVRLTVGSSMGDARLARNATLAVEVERSYVPGHDPRQMPPPVIARFYAPDGGVEWQDAAGTRTIDNASRWTIAEGETSDALADSSPPDWIDQEPVVQLSEQRYGAPVVESTLTSDKPVDIQLLELFQGNGRKEVKSLAAKSSVHVGLFEPFIDALRDSDQKSNWRTHIETLRAAMALGPESATNVWQSLFDQRGRQAGADLYEMLCGYNEEQIGRTPQEMQSGALLRLIDWLEEDSLDYRVLAVHDLWEITGKRLMPDPSANLKERTQNVRRWRARLEEGDLQPVRRQ